MKGMVLTMKIFAIELIFNGGRTENAVHACAAYDETISIPEKSGATAVVLGNTESDAIRSLLNVLTKRKERSGVTWKARELKEYRK